MALDWPNVEPVLLRVYGLMDAAPFHTVEYSALAVEFGFDDDDPDLGRTLRLLDKVGFLDAEFAGMHMPMRVEPTERGLQYARAWPKPGEGEVDALLRILDAHIASPETPDEERPRLQRLRDAAGDMTQSVLANLLAAWGRQVTGLG